VADLHHLAAEHAVIQEIRSERARQDAKWGEQNHPDGTGPSVMVLEGVEHYTNDELSDAPAHDLAHGATLATDISAGGGTVTWRDILLEETFEALAEDDPQKLRTELVQVAAVATQWVEAIDRRLMDDVHAERADRRG
jgi:hypothetical protein